MNSALRVVYVAGPFRSPSEYVPGQQDAWGIQCNVMHAMTVGLEVWRMGAVALIPHANSMFFQNAAPDRVWLDGDLALLTRCDAVIMVPNWRISSGARAEHDFAIEHHIPVFYHLRALRSWLSGEEVVAI